MEEWKDVVGYEDLYQVSNEGRVKSLDRVVIQKTKWGGFISKKYNGKILKQFLDKDGYYEVNLCKQDGGKMKRVNRLVAEAFIPNPNNLPIADHINTIRTDNRVENLRWVDDKGNNNNEKTLKTKSKVMKGKMAGESHPFFNKKRPEHSKKISIPIVQVDIQTGSIFNEWESTIKCAKEIVCSPIKLCLAVNGKNRKKGHEFKGYLWYKKEDYSSNNYIIAPKTIV